MRRQAFRVLRESDVVAHRPGPARPVTKGAAGKVDAPGKLMILIIAAVKVLKAGMRQRHMVPFIVDIAHRLPVHRQVSDPTRRPVRDHCGAAIGGEIRCESGQKVGHSGLWTRFEAQEDEAVKNLHLDRLEVKAVAVEIGETVGPRHAPQRAVKVVDPAVKRADDGTTAASLHTVHHSRAAVAAEVVEGPHLSVLPAHDDGPFAKDVERQPVTHIRHVRNMADNLPMGQKHAGPFQRQNGLGMIGPGW